MMGIVVDQGDAAAAADGFQSPLQSPKRGQLQPRSFQCRRRPQSANAAAAKAFEHIMLARRL